MLDKLAQIDIRFEEVKQQIMDPEIMSDMKKYKAVNIAYKELEEIHKKGEEYKRVLSNIDNSKEMIELEDDAEMKEMAKEELNELLPRKEQLEEEIKMLLIPRDPNDKKNCIIEIRSGTGGDEAALFAGDLFRMYQKFSEGKGLSVSITSVQEGTSGGFKEIVAQINGNSAYGTLKFESGVHRVQRVPKTESQGRIHTSAATVAIMPEAEEFDVELNDSDIDIERTTSTGPGGQSVNTTYSAIKLHHRPTGIRVSMQDEKSQLKNLAKAMKILRDRVYNMQLQKRKAEEDSERRSMVGSGDRSEKIRTYNYPQGRVTDHRIGLTIYNLNGIMDGELDQIIEKLQLAENSERLKNAE
ncbi:MAG: peptide chain release factor 1 [Bacteroidota bacterium]